MRVLIPKRRVNKMKHTYPDWNDNGPGTRAHDTGIGPYSIDGVRYLDGKTLAELQNEKRNANRRARDQAYRDCGLVRVRGALGGVYWE